MVKVTSVSKLSAYSVNEFGDLTESFLEVKASEMTANRIIVSANSLCRYAFGDNKLRSFYTSVLWSYIQNIASKEFEKQKKVFLEGNIREVAINKDCWKVYYLRGPNLIFRKFDFNKIKVRMIRLEVKYYAKYRLGGLKKIDDNFLNTITKAITFITDNNDKIKCFADVKEEDVRRLYIFLESEHKTCKGISLSLASIKSVIHTCAQVVKYLKSEIRDDNLKTPIPVENYFAKYKFRNIDKFRISTLEIPDEVIREVEKHVYHELNETYQVVYKVFLHTGLRAQEVLTLKSDCIEKSNYENVMQLKYTPLKILGANRKRGIGDYNRMLIPMFLADEIQAQIEKSRQLREKYDLSYIFLVQASTKCYLASYVTFCRKLNILTSKYKIVDEKGDMWKFTCRQFRKTIAVSLIESGATTAELGYWLGHLTSKAAIQYYEDIRKKRLVEMNTEFFKMKFDLLLSKEQLENYSEEQRRLLYVDFILEQRRVELGFCVKPIANGNCEERNRMISCVNCKNLCTGSKYLSYWEELRESQQVIVDKLLDFYDKNNIDDYEKYKEYKQEKYLLDCYNNIIEKIITDSKGGYNGC